MRKLTAPLLLVLLGICPGALRSSARAAEPAGAVAGPASAKIHSWMDAYVAGKEVAGVTTLVAAPDQITHLDSVGWANIEKRQPMRPDTICWIASMTKPIVGLSVCLLEEEGKLRLDEPVSKYIPEFAELKNSAGQPVQVTILQLLTHTSGMADVKGDETAQMTKLAELIPLYVSKPVNFPPGSKWSYCQSSINTAGRLIEVVSGQELPDFLEKRFFAPLGMKDTTFYVTQEQLPRLATPYERTAVGELFPTGIKLLTDKHPTDRNRFPAANGGLFSTALDYAKFCQLLLNHGSANGQQLVKPATVERFHAIQTSPDLVCGFTPGNGWGVGCCIVRQPQGITADFSPGTYGHGGAYGTQAWIDPQKKIAVILMVQRSNFQNADASSVRAAFQAALFEK
jgi:CubicO group peptidase (beta-lactamase class C family)